MNLFFFLLLVVFGIAGYQESRRFEREYGRTPWGWSPWIWGVIMFLSFVIGLVLIAIAERQGRRRPMPVYPQASQYAYADARIGVPAPALQAGASIGSDPTEYGGRTWASSAALPSAVQAPIAAPVPAGQWAADPSGRHQYRWWDGSAWTQHVVSDGVSSQDPIDG